MIKSSLRISGFTSGLMGTAFALFFALPTREISAQEVIWRGPVSAYYFGNTRRTARTRGQSFENANGERYVTRSIDTTDNGNNQYNAGQRFAQDYSHGHGNVYAGGNSAQYYGVAPYFGPAPNYSYGPAPYYNTAPYSTSWRPGDLGYSRYFSSGVSRFVNQPDQAYNSYGYGSPGVSSR